jgi:hypothetical protein
LSIYAFPVRKIPVNFVPVGPRQMVNHQIYGNGANLLI